MQTFYKRFSVITGFILLLLVLLVNGLVLRRQVAVQINDQAWVAHTRQVLYELSQTESLLKDLERSQRGYLYTGDETYLGPYNAAPPLLAAHLDQLARLTADNPRQQAQMPVLQDLVRRKLDEMAQTVALAKAGRAAEAKALVVSDVGLRYMEQISHAVGKMEAEENALSASRSRAYERSVQITLLCIYLASLFAIAGLALLAYFILREMKLREKHAGQLKEREEWFRVTLTSVGEAVIATDELGKVTFLNPLAERLTGVSTAEAVGKMIQEVFPIFNEYTLKVVDNPVKQVIEEGKTVGLANHTVLKSRDGVLTPIEDSAAPIWDDSDKMIGVVLVFRDATLNRKAEELLRRTEKLAAAARLSATVAHEINNPLEAVGNLIYLAKMTPAIPDSAVERLEMAEQELERVSHITRQTLGFYRESNVPDVVQMEQLIETVLMLYSNKLNAKNIRLERQFAECPPIQGLSGELKQAISNLISNAADAVGQNGLIRVTLVCVQDAESRMVHVSIEDDGPGIADEHIERIFEPFFTTKKDVGTGLGLWGDERDYWQTRWQHRGRVAARDSTNGNDVPVADSHGAAAGDVARQ